MIFNIDFAHLGMYRNCIIDFVTNIPRNLIQIGNIFHVNQDCGLEVVGMEGGVVYIQVVGV